MQDMLQDLEDYHLRVAKQLNLVQLHFYEPYALFGRPLMKLSALHAMFCTYYINLQILASSSSLRAICRELPMLGAIIKRPVYLTSECFVSSGEEAWMVPWRVRVVLPEDNQSKLERSQAQALLYCPLPDEISNEIDWFEKAMAADSLTHQFLSIIEHERRSAIVRKNLLKNPCSIWEEAKERWHAAPTEESDPDAVYDLASEPQKVDDIDFAPAEGQSLALAYEAVMRSIRTRSCRHRQPLRTIYKEALERAMFEDVPWDDAEKTAFLKEWKSNFFKQSEAISQKPTKTPKKPLKQGRWNQCAGVDDITASNLIKYFITEFIANPRNKKAGEIACVLLILVWIAQEGDNGPLAIPKVLQLTTKDIASEDDTVVIGRVETIVSWGLKQLLECLRGKGEGKRGLRLFASLDPSGKALERALIEASKKILPEGASPVLPAAFLISPHVYQGVRMSSAQRNAMRSAKPIVPLRHMSYDIKKALLNIKERKILKKPLFKPPTPFFE